MSLLEVGPGKPYKIPRAAVVDAKAGDRIEVQAGMYAGVDAPCRITVPDLSIVAVGGRVCINARNSANTAFNVLGQGLWQIELPAGGITIDGFDFIGAAVSAADGLNCAGVRLQAGDLTCIDCGWFFNQNGLLAAAPNSKVRLTRPHFAWNGTGRGTEHNIYVSTGAAELIFEYGISRNSPSGQCIKSRAAKTTVLYSMLGESAAAADGNSNYEISTPNGGELTVIGCLVLQNPSTSNAHIITSGEEGITLQGTKTVLMNNTIVGYRVTNAFVRNAVNAADFPGEVIIKNNFFVGAGAALYEGKPPTEDKGNVWVKSLVAALFNSATDYRVKPTSPAAAAGSGIGPDAAYQPLIPFGVEPRASWISAGAFAAESTAPPLTIPAVAYGRPVTPVGYEKVSGSPVVVVIDQPNPAPAPTQPTPAPVTLPEPAPSLYRGHYVNQPAIASNGGATWTYLRPGASNVQVWRNGLLQAPGLHYVLDGPSGTITPASPWAATDVVMIAYVF